MKTKLFFSVLFALMTLQVSAEESMPLWSYTVKSGDNLINIAKAHLAQVADWKQVQAFNHIKNPYQIPVGTVLKVPLSLVKHQPAAAEVISISGVANLQNNELATPLSLGQKLTVGAKLVTGKNSKVIIKFADGTITQLASNSVLILDTLSLYSGGAMADTKLRLQQGQVETRANPKAVRGNQLQVITPTAIAAVRGTEFRVSADNDSVKQETLVGQVNFQASNQTVAVNKGYGTVSEQGKPPVAPVALLPAVDTAKLPNHIENLPAIFTMPKLDGAVTWLGRVSSDAEHTKVIVEQEVRGGQLDFDGLSDGTYYLSVRAKDALGISGYDARHQFTVNTQPSAPTLTYPENAAVIHDARPVFAWQPIGQAQAYQLQLATDAEFNHIVINQRTSQHSVSILHDLTAGQYYWRVATITLEGQQEDKGPYTSAAAFVHTPLPTVPDISRLKVSLLNNHVYVDTIPPADGMTYRVRLANPYNHQENVWLGEGLSGQFDFALREYGAQQLYIQHVDAHGVAGPAAFYEFDASPL